MYSEEFMRYLINYQKAEPKKAQEKSCMSIPFNTNSSNKKLATILLAIKK